MSSTVPFTQSQTTVVSLPGTVSAQTSALAQATTPTEATENLVKKVFGAMRELVSLPPEQVAKNKRAEEQRRKLLPDILKKISWPPHLLQSSMADAIAKQVVWLMEMVSKNLPPQGHRLFIQLIYNIHIRKLHKKNGYSFQAFREK